MIVADPTDFTHNRIYVASGDTGVNGSPAANSAGVWRYDGTNWVNLTSIVSDKRSAEDQSLHSSPDHEANTLLTHYSILVERRERKA